MELREFISTLEAAQILDCAPDTVRLMARSGRLPIAITTGAGRVYRRSDIEAFAMLRKGRRAATPPEAA